MAIYAHYDHTGTIRALISVKVPRDKAAGMMMAPKPGLFVAEVEGLKLKSDPPSREEARALAATHRIATPFPCTKLVRKKD
jgi:hypothetical protein